MDDGPTLDGRPAELIDSGLMDDGPILDGRPAELIDSGLMDDGPTLDGRPAELIDSGLMDDGPTFDGLEVIFACILKSSFNRRHAMWVWPPLAASMRIVELSFSKQDGSAPFIRRYCTTPIWPPAQANDSTV
jgi:hypothetical protein